MSNVFEARFNLGHVAEVITILGTAAWFIFSVGGDVQNVKDRLTSIEKQLTEYNQLSTRVTTLEVRVNDLANKK